MRKFLALSFFLSAALVLTFAACSNSPSNPSGNIPYVFEAGGLMGDFENNTLSFATDSVTGTFSVSNDSAEGGTSPMPLLSVTGTDGSTGGSYMLALTATVNTTLAWPLAGNLFALDIGYTNCGYVKLVINLNKAADLDANNNMFIANAKISNNSGMDYKMFFYNADNNVAYGSIWQSISTAFGSPYTIGSMVDASMSVPAGSSYTAADVVTAVKKIVIIFRYRDTSTAGTKTFTIFMDDFRLYNT